MVRVKHRARCRANGPESSARCQVKSAAVTVAARRAHRAPRGAESARWNPRWAYPSPEVAPPRAGRALWPAVCNTVIAMQVIDLRPEFLPAYLACLEEWSSEMEEAGDHKARWYERMRDRGLRVKLALDDRDRPVGMIQYVPAEHAAIAADDGTPGVEGLYFILCIWVHGHKQGVGNQQGKGIGAALLAAAEADARALGATGMVAWGLFIPVWMKASWYKKRGYRSVDRDGLGVLLFKPFSDDVAAPKWLRLRKKPRVEDDKVVVTACHSGWCPGMNIAFERARLAAGSFGDQVEFRVVDTCCDRATMAEWGVAEALFIDDKPVRTGPPPSKKKLTKLIGKRVRRKGGSR